MARHDATLFEFASLWLEHDTYNVKDLAEHLDVSLKHVYAMKKKLVESWGIELSLAKENPNVPRGEIGISPAGRDKLRAVLELVDSLPLAAREPDYGVLETALYVPLNSERYLEGVMRTLLQAIAERRVVHMHYRNNQGDVTPYEVHCYRLVVRGDHLYVYSADEDNLKKTTPNMQLRRLDRIERIVLLEDTFAPPSFDVEGRIDYNFGAFRYGDDEPTQRVRIRFDKSKVNIVKDKKRHLLEEHETLEDGSLIWQTDMPLVESLVYWIVSYGEFAEVLEPLELRTMVREFAEGTVRVNAPK